MDANVNLFSKINDKLGQWRHEAPPQSKVVTGKFVPEVKETPRLPARNRAERRALHREVVREHRAEMRAQGKRSHARRVPRSEIFSRSAMPLSREDVLRGAKLQPWQREVMENMLDTVKKGGRVQVHIHK
jgi:hypothetical protein